MEKYLKLLRKLNPDIRLKLILAMEKIANGDLTGLDVKKIAGEVGLYRCRVGKIRIIFRKQGDGFIVLDMGYRGSVY